jgi:hypothetical protein
LLILGKNVKKGARVRAPLTFFFCEYFDENRPGGHFRADFLSPMKKAVWGKSR